MEEKEVKKRLLVLTTALVMTLSAGMTTLAAESPVVDNEDDSWAESATVMIDGNEVKLDFDWDLNVKNLTEEQKKEVEYYIPAKVEILPAGDEAARENLDAKTDARTRELFEKVMGNRNDKAIRRDYFGLTLPAGYSLPENGAEVTIKADYVGKEGAYNYYIFHCREDGTWEYIPTTQRVGSLTGKFTSFSPVFIIRVPKEDIISTGNESEPVKDTTTPTTVPATTTATNTTTTTTTTGNTTSTAKAPKTGESAGVYVAGMFAILSAAGIVVYVKKEKIVK